MQFPIIHNNGTGRQMLQTDYDAAAEKLREFTEAFQGIEFNARDYYVKGPDAFTQAQEERREMFSHIRALDCYLTAIREHLYE